MPPDRLDQIDPDEYAWVDAWVEEAIEWQKQNFAQLLREIGIEQSEAARLSERRIDENWESGAILSEVPFGSTPVGADLDEEAVVQRHAEAFRLARDYLRHKRE